MKKKQKIKSCVFHNFKLTIQEIWKTSPVYLFIVIFHTLSTNLLPVASLLVMQSIINAIQAKNIIFKTIIIFVTLYVFIEIFQTLLLNLIGHYQTKFTLKFNLKIKRRILNHAAELSLKDYENSEIYDTIQRAQYMNEGHILTFSSQFIQLGGAIIKLFAYSAILFELGAAILSSVLILPIIQFFVLKAINTKEVKILQSRTEDERQSIYFSQLISNGINYKELKLYNLFDHFISLYTDNIQEFNNQDITLSQKKYFQSSFFSILDEIVSGLIFAYIIFLGFMGRIMLGNVITYSRSIIEAKTSVQNLFNILAEIQRESLLLDQLFAFFDLSPSGNNMYVPEKLIEIDKIDCIELVNLSYKYRTNDQYVLKNINLKISSGETIAILGENGSGKTTLVKIIMGFYNDYEGKIYVNGIDLRNIDMQSYMKRIGALFQDFSKYEATLRENISFGNLQMMDNDALLLETCKEFNLQEILDLDRSNINMQLGSWFRNGRQLSIGQWQKVALARAFLKDADVYILDEPNASLDIIAEHQLTENYKKVFSGKIGIVIAHRFHQFIQSANCIIVLKNGTLVESGTHGSLLTSGGVYATLFYLQSN